MDDLEQGSVTYESALNVAESQCHSFRNSLSFAPGLLPVVLLCLLLWSLLIVFPSFVVVHYFFCLLVNVVFVYDGVF